MKQIFLICLSIAFAGLGFSQEVNDIKKVPHLHKGKIMLINGTTFHFTNLEVRNDTVICTDPQLNVHKHAGADVYKISKPGTYAGVGAITGGFGGLFGALIGTSNWNKYPGLSAKRGSFIVGTTLFCTALGGFAGALINREKTIYKNYTAFSFGLDYDSFIVNEPVVMLTFKIKL